MKSDIPKDFKEGDELTASLVNDVLKELWRWRQIQAAPPIHIDNEDSDIPPTISSSVSPYSLAWGQTPTGGYSGGTISSPASNTTSMTLYFIPGNTSATISVSKTYTTYGSTVSSGKTALYMMFPDGNWYIITADC